MVAIAASGAQWFAKDGYALLQKMQSMLPYQRQAGARLPVSVGEARCPPLVANGGRKESDGPHGTPNGLAMAGAMCGSWLCSRGERLVAFRVCPVGQGTRRTFRLGGRCGGQEESREEGSEEDRQEKRQEEVGQGGIRPRKRPRPGGSSRSRRERNAQQCLGVSIATAYPARSRPLWSSP